MIKLRIFKIIFCIWIILWIFFLVREDKTGQYESLKYYYTHGYNDNIRYILGDNFYDFLVFCEENMPARSTYELIGLKKFSIKEVRARYYLWPYISVKANPDFKLVYGKHIDQPGYREYRNYPGGGYIFIRDLKL